MKLNRNIRIAKSKPIIKLNPSIEDDEYFNYTKVLKNLKYRDFLIYLINNKCPYHDSLKEELIPCKITREECCNTLKLIFEKYHDNPLIFTTYPIFSITYICGLLNVVTTLEKNLNVTKDAIIFITSFLKDVQVSFQQNGRRNDKEFESVLDFIIPTFLYNASNDSTSSKMTFILYLIEFFGVNILLHHLMNFLETVVEIKSMITRFHLNILNTISERYIIHNGNIKRMRDFALNMIESKNAEQVKILLRTLEESDAYSYSNHDDSRNHDKDEASDELSQQTPISKSSDNNIHSFYSHRRTASCNLKKSNSNYPFVSSPLLLSSSRKNREFPIESLGSLIDKIEHEPNLADEELIQSLNQIRGQLVQQKIFPINHDFRKILDISFGLYNKYDTENVKITDEQTIIFLLISTMNSICDSQQLLHYYLATKSNMISQNKNFIEQCYQHFLKTSNIQNNNFNSNIPFSLVSQNDLQNYLREDVEFAFTCLNHWQSSYDGVKRIWDILKNDPESDINEYFDMLEFTQKSFIVEGMRNIMKEEKNEAKMKVVIDMLENRMMNETKSDRVVKEASEVSEKMNNIIQNKGAFQTPIRSSKSAIGILNSTPRDRERAIRSRASSVRFSLNIEDDIAHAIAEEKKKHSDQEIISPENIPESDEPINTLKISNEQTLSKHQNTSDKQYLNRRMIPPQSRSGSHTKGASLRRNYS